MAEQQQAPTTNQVARGSRLQTVVTAAAFAAGVVGGGLGDYYLRNPPPAAVYFSPQGGCTKAIVEEIKGAKSDIRVQAFILTAPDIVDALIQAHGRDVRVRVLLDKGWLDRSSSSSILARQISAQGVTVQVDDQPGKAHNKVIIIDDRKVITGSFNFTKPAEDENRENVVILSDPGVCARYLQNWERLWGVSRPLQPNPQPNALTPITPEEALKRLNQSCVVEMKVMSVGTFNDLIFLNSRQDHSAGDNFYFVIYPEGTPKRFANHEAFLPYAQGLVGKTVRVSGTVTKPNNGGLQIQVKTPAQVLRFPDGD
jgi:phosphatidylserine/phosphatidylglycerophosphate/cardiolipin synthase-like enzyme